MAGNGSEKFNMSHHEDSDTDLSMLEGDRGECCCRQCTCCSGCRCSGCMGRRNLMIVDESASVYPGQGGGVGGQGAGSQGVRTLPINIPYHTPDALGFDGFNNSLEEDAFEPANHSWQAPRPVGDLTHTNIDLFNQEIGDGRADFLRKHEIDVDAQPDRYFLSPPEKTETDPAEVIEGGGMEESLNVENDLLGDSRSSRQCKTSCRASTMSLSAILPDMRSNLVHQPLPLVPEYRWCTSPRPGPI